MPSIGLHSILNGASSLVLNRVKDMSINFRHGIDTAFKPLKIVGRGACIRKCCPSEVSLNLHIPFIFLPGWVGWLHAHFVALVEPILRHPVYPSEGFGSLNCELCWGQITKRTGLYKAYIHVRMQSCKDYQAILGTLLNRDYANNNKNCFHKKVVRTGGFSIYLFIYL